MPEFLSDLYQKKIRMCDFKSENKCFVIKDSKKVLIFMRNTNQPTRQTFAWWSDSDTLVDIISTLYYLSWEKGESIYCATTSQR